MLYVDIFYYSSSMFNGKYLQILSELVRKKNMTIELGNSQQLFPLMYSLTPTEHKREVKFYT